jgi:hypothetical protein
MHHQKGTNPQMFGLFGGEAEVREDGTLERVKLGFITILSVNPIWLLWV